MKTVTPALAQYGLAALSLVCFVVVNIFGTESETLNNVLLTVLGATAWGGLQRQVAEKSKEN